MRMIDKAAKAAFDSNWGGHPGGNSEWDRVGGEWIKWQRAAIESLMEPSLDMMDASHDAGLGVYYNRPSPHGHHWSDSDVRQVEKYQAALHAVLDEKE